MSDMYAVYRTLSAFLSLEDLLKVKLPYGPVCPLVLVFCQKFPKKEGGYTSMLLLEHLIKSYVVQIKLIVCRYVLLAMTVSS